MEKRLDHTLVFRMLRQVLLNGSMERPHAANIASQIPNRLPEADALRPSTSACGFAAMQPVRGAVLGRRA